MGKSLVIKGADFSENGIDLEVLGIDRNEGIAAAVATGASSSGAYADADYSSLQGKHIMAIEFKPTASGTFRVVKCASIGAVGLIVLATINVQPQDVGVKTKYSLDIIVGDNDIIGVNPPGDSASFYYCTTVGGSFYIDLGKSTCHTVAYNMAINWYIED